MDFKSKYRMSKLWIIGDSFTGLASCGNPSWPEILADKFVGGKYFISSRSSRDFQTILDIFLRHLKKIKEDDFVILAIPTLVRTRLPLQKPVHDITKSNFYRYEDATDYFIGTHSYTADSEYYKLEAPLTGLDDKIVNESVSIWSIVNSSEASKKNYLGIIESLKKYFPFEIFVWSWEDELKSDLIENKSQITKSIGFWHTYCDLYNETNGLEGKKDDGHFSPKMHKAFADYLIVKFPQFFNT